LETDQLTRVPAEDRLVDVARVPVQCLGERLIGHADLLVAATVQRDPALIEGGLGHLGGSAGLADSRLTAQHDGPAPPGRRLPTGPLQAAHQLLTADVAGGAPDRQQSGKRDPGGASTLDLRRRLPRRLVGHVAPHRRRVEREQPPALGEPLELAHSQVDEPQPASSHELADRGTDHHLPGSGLAHHPCRQVHPDPGHRIPVELHLSGMQSGADLDRQRRQRRQRRPHRRGRGVEPGQKPVPCGVHLPATMSRQRGPDHAVVAGQQPGPGRVPQVSQAVGRSHDVGEQQRLHPTRHRLTSTRSAPGVSMTGRPASRIMDLPMRG
jgi:hypothetical protein